MRSFVKLSITLCLALACEDDAPRAFTAHKVPGPAPAEPIVNVAVSGELGFDLAPLADGALLVIAERDGGVSARLLDGEGAVRGKPLWIAPASDGKAFEVAAASLGTRIGAAWVAESRGGSASFGALGDAATKSFSPPQLLGEAPRRSTAEAGFVALSASEEGGFVALRRGLDEPCEGDQKRSCASFGFRELLPGAVERRGLAMSVPAPCARPLAGFVSDGERWHYGLCSLDRGAALTTHFMRQLSPFYVDVHHSLEGCTPLGATALGGDVIFAGDCAEGRRGVRVGGMGSKPQRFELAQASVDCVGGRPRLRAPGEAPLELHLREPRAGLELLLPGRVVPGHSRAAWTGMRLLTATWLAGDVVLRRFECRGSELVPD